MGAGGGGWRCRAFQIGGDGEGDGAVEEGRQGRRCSGGSGGGLTCLERTASAMRGRTSWAVQWPPPNVRTLRRPTHDPLRSYAGRLVRGGGGWGRGSIRMAVPCQRRGVYQPWTSPRPPETKVTIAGINEISPPFVQAAALLGPPLRSLPF